MSTSSEPRPTPDGANPPPRLVAVAVTWNRPDDIRRLVASLEALESAPPLTLIVVDNASDAPVSGLKPFEEHIANASLDPAAPQFAPAPELDSPARQATATDQRIERLLIVRNRDNLGGCGGFLTGYHVANQLLAKTDHAFLWLLDDDATPTPPSLRHMLNAMSADPRLGAVGARMADPADPDHILEGPVYFDRETGIFQPAPREGTPHHAAFTAWRARVDAKDPCAETSGLIPCDIMAACSLLCRWSAVRKAGFWDPRYFLAADDAEWCIRLAANGYGVACCLDAVVLHEPWHRKRTPEREYYRRRNMLWLWERHLPRETFVRLTKARRRQMFRISLRAMRRKNFKNAEIFRRTIQDAATSVGGRLHIHPPPPPLRRPRMLARWLRTFLASRRWLKTKS